MTWTGGGGGGGVLLVGLLVVNDALLAQRTQVAVLHQPRVNTLAVVH